jgi:glutamate-5-semialdehyde dehydrogenase
MKNLGIRAKKASHTISNASSELKNKALLAISDELKNSMDYILSQNAIDIENGKNAFMSGGLLDRLLLNRERILDICKGIEKLISLDDPIGKVDYGNITPSGIHIHKTRVPLGIVGMIYESRPNVTVDAATICLKTGNCVILRGGKEAINSNTALVNVMRTALKKTSLDEDVILLVEDTSREIANEMMKLSDYLDVLIPRGGAKLISSVKENATVAVIETGTGNCHIYVDECCDLDMAVNITYNAKTHRISVCNSAESLVVHKSVAEKFLPLCKAKLDEKNVELVGCEETRRILGESVGIASEDDFYCEFLDYKMSVIVVDSIEDAISHINKYSTHHSEAIVTSNLENSRKFSQQIDSACVYVNASTRFTDGGEFGLGAEIGISTQKLHARGPMGLVELTSYKYVCVGNGQIR